MTAGAVWLIYAPAHWLTPFTGAVTVDEHPAQADLYIGHPTNREAEAIAFVHIPGVGDYFLDFEEEKYREASSNEFVRFKPRRVDVCTYERRPLFPAPAISRNQ